MSKAQIAKRRKENKGKLPSFTDLGGYPLFYLDSESDVYCPECANQTKCTYPIVNYDINWEDEDLYCEGCSKQISSAYGDDKE